MASRANKSEPLTPEPDLTIGIDFGMTGTAVAYASRYDRKVKVLRTWRDGASTREKVPSAVLYKDSTLVSWGFGIREQENATGVLKAFKGVIDRGDIAHFRGQNPDAPKATRRLAITWLQDYLRQLHEWLEEFLQKDLPQKSSWNESRILFLFSFPTTWRKSYKGKKTTLESFREAIRDAGYGACGLHQVKVTLSEVEAAMACCFTSGPLPSKGENLIMVDIGGGTCDVGIYTVEYDKDIPYPRLKQLNGSMGTNAGSSKIDEYFEEKVAEILRPAFRKANPAITTTADVEAMVALATRDVSNNPAYEGAKHDFGRKGGTLTKKVFEIQTKSLPVPESVFKQLKSAMEFNKQDLFQPPFDEQCNEIWDLIDRHIQIFLDSQRLGAKKEKDTKNVKKPTNENMQKQKLRLILSGGMSRSIYVQDFLTEKLQKRQHVDIDITMADEPQLVVCRGLVESELRDRRNEGMWKCRAKFSYGIVHNGAPGDIKTLAILKGKEFKSGGRIVVEVPLQLDANGRIELSIAEFPGHYRRSRVWPALNSSSNLGEPVIIGTILESIKHETTQKKPFWPRDSKLKVEFQLYLGFIICKVTHMEAPLGGERIYGWSWHCEEVGSPNDSPAPRAPLGARFEEWWESIDRQKAAKIAVFLGFFGVNLFKNKDMTAPEDAYKTAKKTFDDTESGMKDVDSGIHQIRKRFQDMDTATENVLRNAGMGLAEVAPRRSSEKEAAEEACNGKQK